MTCDQHIVVTCTQRYSTEQHSHVIAIFMLNKCHPITLELCVKYYYRRGVSVQGGLCQGDTSCKETKDRN